MAGQVGCGYCGLVMHDPRGRSFGRLARLQHYAEAHPEVAGRTEHEHNIAGRAIWAQKIERLVGLYGRRCLGCGMSEPQAIAAGRGRLTIDHVIPRSRNGPDDITNWQPLCRSCNNIKGDAIIDYRPSAIVAGLLAAIAAPAVIPNAIIVVTDPGTCQMRRIGRMGWCDAHEQPMGHAIREALAAARAARVARQRAATASRERWRRGIA